MNTHETYVSLETAKMLKEAGFDWECNQGFNPLGEPCTWYNHKWIGEGLDLCEEPTDECLVRPTLAVAQRWLREVKDTYIIPQISDYEANGCIWEYDYRTNIHNINPIRSLCKYKSYEEALEEGIKTVLNLFKEDKNYG